MMTPLLVTLYHNPRCSKSRATLALLENRGIIPTLIHYLDTPLSRETLVNLITWLGFSSAHQLIRQNEPEYAALDLANPKCTEDELLEALATHPILIERPIVVYNNAARIGRPPEHVLTLFPVC